MARRPPRPPHAGHGFFETYTAGLTTEGLHRLFTRDAHEAYQFFARDIDEQALKGLSGPRRLLAKIRLFFWAFTLTLSPARRALYGIAVAAALLALLKLSRGVELLEVPLVAGVFLRVSVPFLRFEEGAGLLLAAFLLLNLLVLLEVADRLTLKDDLEIAREIQQAMLPHGTFTRPGLEAFGTTTPANTVGGDFYDILPQPDGRLIVALGDVAGKGSPASLLMALLLAILRTLVDDALALPELMRRLNVQVGRHAPRSRFITLWLAAYEPATGALTYVNAGHTPPLILRASGAFDRLTDGGIALGMFEHAQYSSAHAMLEPGDALVLYSDGVTEAEDHRGAPFDERGLERIVAAHADASAQSLGTAIIDAVTRHAGGRRLADDVTVLVLRPAVTA